jgi:hypothetical protein
MSRALAGDWPEQPTQHGRALELVCRPTLDVHHGTAGWYRERHGNLRRDGVLAVLGRALAVGGRPAEAPWFNLDPLPPVAELAIQHGDVHSQSLHFTATSVRSLWLDRALQAH